MTATHFTGPVVSANGIVATTGGLTIGSTAEIVTAQVTLTTAQMLALNGTPITIIAAPGAGLAIIPTDIVAYKVAGTAYTVAGGNDLVLKYTDGSGAQCSAQVETTGFLDQTTAQLRYVGSEAVSVTTNITPVANAAVVAQILVGEITGGVGTLTLKVTYKIIPTVLS